MNYDIIEGLTDEQINELYGDKLIENNSDLISALAVYAKAYCGQTGRQFYGCDYQGWDGSRVGYHGCGALSGWFSYQKCGYGTSACWYVDRIGC